MEDNLKNNWVIPVVEPDISVLDKQLTVPIEDVPSFTDFAHRQLKLF